MFRTRAILLPLLILSTGAVAQNLKAPAGRSCVQSKAAVVYDAVTGIVDMIVVPSCDADLTGSLAGTLAVPGGVTTTVQLSTVQSSGLKAALSSAAPNAKLLSPEADQALVNSAIAASAASPDAGTTAQ